MPACRSGEQSGGFARGGEQRMTGPTDSATAVAGADAADDGGVVIGVDIGTTSTKSVAFTVDGEAVADHSVGYPLNEPSPGYAEQDPAVILDAVRQTVAQVVRDCPQRVRGLSFSTAMHSLIGLDESGAPLPPSVTWADSRASAQA